MKNVRMLAMMIAVSFMGSVMAMDGGGEFISGTGKNGSSFVFSILDGKIMVDCSFDRQGYDEPQNSDHLKQAIKI